MTFVELLIPYRSKNDIRKYYGSSIILLTNSFCTYFFDFFLLHHNFMGEKTKTDIYLCDIKRLHKVLPPAAQHLLCPTDLLAFSTKFSYLKDHHGWDISLRLTQGYIFSKDISCQTHEYP
jgi:hypothetical protein